MSYFSSHDRRKKNATPGGQSIRTLLFLLPPIKMMKPLLILYNFYSNYFIVLLVLLINFTIFIVFKLLRKVFTSY